MKANIDKHESSASGLPSDPQSANLEALSISNAKLDYSTGDSASSQRPVSRMSDLDVLHARLSNAHLLAHHQFELHPAGGVSYKPHPPGPNRHERQPSHSLLPHIYPSPDAQGPGLLELTRREIERFRSLAVPSALCCIQRQNDDLAQYLINFESLNEGAANAVFSVRSDQGVIRTGGFLFVAVTDAGNTATTIPSHMVADKVLRVSKGLPKSLRSEVIVDGFMADVRPLFVSHLASAKGQTLEDIDLDKHLMAHLPVVLFDEAMSALQKMVPAICPLKDTAQFGILLPNMSTVTGQNVTFEIKPKWLAQSPNAPPEAIRCRTCALQFSRGKGTPVDYICPLRLSHEGAAVDSDMAQIRRWATNALSLQINKDKNAHLPQGTALETLVDRVVAYFTSGDGRTLLLHLKKLQETLDSEGILQRYAHPRDDFNFIYDLRLAMTLRDCSLFVVVPISGGGIISKLADLDFKSAEKVDDWRDKETALVNEGWYVKNPEAHGVCLLAPKTLT